jgi:rubrerythrin
MALPKIVTPEYTLTLPSNGKEIKYRPFLVKEERILLTALEMSGDNKNDQADAIRNSTLKVIDECTFGKLDLDKLPDFDMEYLFLMMRTKSRDEIVKPTYTCKEKDADGNVCGTDNEIKVDLSKVTVNFPKEDLSKVMITDEIGIQFKFISGTEQHVHERVEDSVERMFRIMVDSIDFIFDAEKIYKGAETPKTELVEFIENLSEKDFNKVKNFFDNIPTLKHIIKFKCKKCGYKQDIVLEGLEDFFDLA